MEQEGTIRINCGEKDCGQCCMYSLITEFCHCFSTDLEEDEDAIFQRCPQCLATFKTVPVDIEAAMDNVVQEMSPELYKLMKENK